MRARGLDGDTGAKIPNAGSIATLKAGKSGFVSCIAGATCASEGELRTVQHWFVWCAGGRGQSFEQHSSARALSNAAKHDVRPPPSSNARIIEMVRNRRIIIAEPNRMLPAGTRQ